jgi:hypothetical protein
MHISRPTTFAVLVSACIFAASPTFAGQGRGSGGPKPHPVKPSGSTTHITGPKSSPAPKVQGGGNAASHGPKSTTTAAAAGKGPKTTKAPATVTASGKTKATTKAASTTASTKSKSTTTTTTTASTSTTTTSSTGTTVPLTPVQEKLQKNTNLASKLESRLPPGADLMLAAEGFRNLGQFVAAVNVSNNLNIPFADLKMSMVDDGLSLGQSIQKLRPTADATREASLANSQATVILNTTATTTTGAKKTKTATAVEKPMKTSGGVR